MVKQWYQIYLYKNKQKNFYYDIIKIRNRGYIMRYKRAKKILMFWCIFIGICAVYGSVCMFIDPTGGLLNMQELLPYFEVLPFSDILFKNYIFSGISLLIVNGISNLTASYLLFKDKKIGIILGTVFGFTLML